MTTPAPFAASSTAIAAPMPRLAPVTNAAFPSSLLKTSSPFSYLCDVAFHDNDLAIGASLADLHRDLIFGRVVAGKRILEAGEFDDHITRPAWPLDGVEASAARQEFRAVFLEGDRGRLDIFRIFSRIIDSHARDPVALAHDFPPVSILPP